MELIHGYLPQDQCLHFHVRDLKQFEIQFLIEAAFQNFNCFVFEQSIVFHNAALQNICNVFYFKTSSMCIFKTVKKKSGIGFIVDALFGDFEYLHNSGRTAYKLCIKKF